MLKDCTRRCIILLVSFILTYILFGMSVLLSTSMKLEMIFMNRLAYSSKNLSNPAEYGLQNTQHFYLRGNAGRLGAWFSQPVSQKFLSIEPYILYLHGNGMARGEDHAIELIDMLQKLGCHVMTFDYRGFGDSDGWPTEAGLVDDSLQAYKWLESRAQDRPIFVFGHSLGSAVGSHFSASCETCRNLQGLVLMSPFSNMLDGFRLDALARPFSACMPNYDYYIQDVRHTFETTFWLRYVKVPVLMLHDKFDDHLDYRMARYLNESVADLGKTKFVESDEGLSHCFIHRMRDFRKLIKAFLKLE